MEEAIFLLINLSLNLAKRTVGKLVFILYSHHETRDLWENLMQVLEVNARVCVWFR